MWFAELFAELLLLFEDLKFWKKKRARRKYEKENNLPKKPMWLYPSVKIEIIVTLILTAIFVVTFVVVSKNVKENKTTKNLTTIERLLEAEKKQYGVYPLELKQIIRNNPAYKNLLFDGWKHKFQYSITEDRLTYTLLS